MRLVLLALLPGLAAMAGAAPAADCQPDPQTATRALNAVRALAQSCGPAAPPLRWQALLGASAQRFAQELAARDKLDHVGANGATLRTRLHEAGYVMRLSGENLAGGPETLDEALAQWLASPAHCENLMGGEFEDFGLACVAGPGKFQRYWVLEMAAPVRSSPGR